MFNIDPTGSEAPNKDLITPTIEVPNLYDVSPIDPQASVLVEFVKNNFFGGDLVNTYGIWSTLMIGGIAHYGDEKLALAATAFLTIGSHLTMKRDSLHRGVDPSEEVALFGISDTEIVLTGKALRLTTTAVMAVYYYIIVGMSSETRLMVNSDQFAEMAVMEALLLTSIMGLRNIQNKKAVELANAENPSIDLTK